MKQIWSPNAIYKFLKTAPSGELLPQSLPSGVFCTENFTWGELLLNQCVAPSLGVLENLACITNRLQALRDTVFKNHPVIITSAWRHEDYNKKIGGAPLSKHILGQAIDFCVKDFPPSKIQFLLEDFSGGLGCYKNFTHIDIARKRRF